MWELMIWKIYEFGIAIWLVLSDEPISKRWPCSIIFPTKWWANEQLGGGVKHLPAIIPKPELRGWLFWGQDSLTIIIFESRRIANRWVLTAQRLGITAQWFRGETRRFPAADSAQHKLVVVNPTFSGANSSTFQGRNSEWKEWKEWKCNFFLAKSAFEWGQTKFKGWR